MMMPPFIKIDHEDNDAFRWLFNKLLTILYCTGDIGLAAHLHFH